MAYALIKDDQLAQELTPGLAFIDANGVRRPALTWKHWSDAQLAEIGVLPIVEPGPTPEGQFITSISLQLIEGVPTRVVTYSQIPIPPDAPPTLSQLQAYATEKRWQTEVSGILFDGYGIPTDDRSKTLVQGAFSKAKEDPTEGKRWQVSNNPITFVTFSNAQIIALGLAVEEFTQNTFDVLDGISPLILTGAMDAYSQIDEAFANINRVFSS